MLTTFARDLDKITPRPFKIFRTLIDDEKDIDESQTVWLSGCPYKTKAKSAKKIDI